MQVSRLKLINLMLYIIILINIIQEIIYSINSKFSFIFYITDVLLCLIIIISLHAQTDKKTDNIQLTCWLVFLAYSMFTIIWNDRNLYDTAFRLRYFLQGITILIIVQRFLLDFYFKKLIKFMCFAQVINLILSIYQNRVMGLFPDFCNGLFGFVGYGSGTVGLYSLALSILATVYYLSRDWKLYQSLFIICISAAFCAFAEVKIYYVLFVLSVFLILLLNARPGKEFTKIILIVVAIFLAFYLAYSILEVVLPNNLDALFSINDYIQYDSRSDYAGRLNTIPFILNNQFFNNHLLAMFGSGLGTSSHMYIYELGKTFSETGFLGLGLLVAAIIEPFFKWLFEKEKTPEKLFVAVFSVNLLISIIVWNIPFVRVAVIFTFFFIGLRNVKWD